MWKGNRKPYNKAQLQRRAQALQVESTLLSTQLMLMQNDIIGLIAGNSEMKLYLQSIKQQIHFQDVQNDALKEEIKWLRIATSHMSSNDGAAVPMMNLGEPSYEELQQFYHHHSQGRQLQILPHSQTTRHEKRFDHNNNNGSHNN